MSADANSFHSSITDVAKSEGPDEEFTAKDQQLRGSLLC
jgi:hypothetical protein